MTGRAPFADDPFEIRVVDSHTEGEPTRVVLEGWPRPAGATMEERRDDLRKRFDHLRRAVVCEPRGHAAIVGALMTPAVHADSQCGVIFFNNETYLGMCGHGLIGLVTTLAHTGRFSRGVTRFDTPVGTVSAAELNADGTVTIQNVASRSHALDVEVDVPGVGKVTGDVAYGGNWFFITHLPLALEMSNVAELTRITQAIQDAVTAQGVAGVPIDHIELSGAPTRSDADAKNFVLCSGGEYDRSPCGTGTSAVMAALHARGRLPLGKEWRQESITGSRFVGWLSPGLRGELVPHIRGRAFITGEATLRLDPADPFRFGIGTP